MIVLLVGRKLQSKCFIFQAVCSYGFAGGIFYNIKLKPFKILISRSKSSYIPWRFFEGVQAYNIRLENIQRPRKYAISQVNSEPYVRCLFKSRGLSEPLKTWKFQLFVASKETGGNFCVPEVEETGGLCWVPEVKETGGLFNANFNWVLLLLCM